MMKSPAPTALLIIDMQKAVDNPVWGLRNNPEAESSILQLLAIWRTTGDPVIHIRHLSKDPRSTFRPGQSGVEVKPGFESRTGETVVEKSVPNAFIGTSLESHLRELRIESVVITGVATNNSVEATARMSGDLGFHTIVVSDGTFAFAKTDFSGRQRTADEVHAMSLANLHGEYATVVSTKEIIDMINGEHSMDRLR